MEKKQTIPRSVLSFIDDRSGNGEHFNIRATVLYEKYLNHCINNRHILVSKIKFNRFLCDMGYDFFLDRNKCKVFVNIGNDDDILERNLLVINELRKSDVNYDRIAKALNISITAIYNRMVGLIEFSNDEIKKLIDLKIIDDSLVD